MRIYPLLEKVGSYSGGLKVDRKSGTIFNVKILGFESENGRRYLPEAVKAAVSLYEGIKVNLDHPVGDASDPRSVTDRLGKLVNVRFVAGKGLFGDLKLLMSKPMSETICEAAEVMPDAFGLSHNAQGEGEEDKDGILVINKITEVRHVDLVADPATTKSLAESTTPKKVVVKLKEEGVLATMTKLAMKVRGAAQLLGEGVKIAMQGASDKRYAPFFGSVVKQLGTMQRNLLKDEQEFKKNAATAKKTQGATEGKKNLGLKSRGLKESYQSLVRAEEVAEAALKKVSALLTIQAQLEKDMNALVNISGSADMQKFNPKTVVEGRAKAIEVEKNLLSLKTMMGYWLTGIEKEIDQLEEAKRKLVPNARPLKEAAASNQDRQEMRGLIGKANAATKETRAGYKGMLQSFAMIDANLRKADYGTDQGDYTKKLLADWAIAYPLLGKADRVTDDIARDMNKTESKHPKKKPLPLKHTPEHKAPAPKPFTLSLQHMMEG